MSMRYLIKTWPLWCLLSPFSMAMTSRIYESPIDEVKWSAAPAHPLKCRLEQEIPFYGRAIFQQTAGRKPRFILQVIQPIEEASEGKLLAMPPMWLVNAKPKVKETIHIQTGYEPVVLEYKQANWMLGQLELGWEPSIMMQEWSGAVETSYTKISSVKLGEALTRYTACLQQLLTYSFEDIQRKTISYPNGGSGLSEDDKEYLDKVARYLSIDKDVRAVILKGYTDNVGTIRNNYLLSIDRLNVVQAYLKAKGVNEAMVEVTAFGKRNPIATNDTVKGRAKNRRVTVELRK